MTTQNGASRADRYGLTRKKNITITESAHEQIEAWALANDCYFSVAIETLALIGLGNEDATLLPRLVENAVERILNWQFHRMAKLLSVTALSAAEANLKVDALLLQRIRQEAEDDPDNFVANMTVSSDPADGPARRIRQMRDDIKELAHEQALEQLKRPLDQIDELLSPDGDEEVSNEA